MILCCGEALIDFVPVETKTGETAFQPFNGGSIYNVAMALGRLETPVAFYGGLSTDMFGEQLSKGLKESNVDLTYTVFSNRASTLAFVRFVDGEPHYAFVDDASAGRMLGEKDIPTIPEDISTLHFGSISLIHDPAGATFAKIAASNHKKKIISLDPNIRPGQIKDRESHLQRLKKMIHMADIVKLSDVDLDWIAPGEDAENIIHAWQKEGPAIVVLTKGKAGATAFYKNSTMEVEPVVTRVADTIGAGDTLMAGFLASLHEAGFLSRQAFAKITTDDLQKALHFSVRAASINVSRPGADPPWRAEM